MSGGAICSTALDSEPKKNHALTLSFSILSVSSSTLLVQSSTSAHHAVAGSACPRALKGASSLNIAKRIPAVFRASATAATFLPRFSSMRAAHSQSGFDDAFFRRIVESATCVTDARTGA